MIEMVMLLAVALRLGNRKPRGEILGAFWVEWGAAAILPLQWSHLLPSRDDLVAVGRQALRV